MQSLYLLLHYLLTIAYLAAPVALVLMALRRRGNGGPPPLAALGTFAAGTAMGISLAVVYAVAVKGRVSISQAVLAAYLATSLMILLRAFDALLQGLIWRISVRTEAVEEGRPPVIRVHRLLALGGNLTRVLVLFGFGLPFVMSAVVTYRPKVHLIDDPMSQLGWFYEPVRFEATDGVRISGWFIPAQDGARRLHSRKTAILCHGLGANKSNHLVLGRLLVPAGYNLLVIDHRAHGESAGQLSSFGDLERRDVLGAVRWLRQSRPQSAERIFGVGASQGAAAVLAAAVDRSPEGQAIEAVALYGSFDDLQALAGSLADKTFLPPFNWLLEALALPIASAHVGADLAAFKPAELADQLWPRPILIIHGVKDQIIDFRHGQMLFDRATQPKQSLWIDHGDHNSIISSDEAAAAVLHFFETARAMPLI
ncbi:MAG: alpha/beta hydrolase [Phycisphaerae bacterium]|nr:alpha/beta hydrolase [Phycisphaerae bacterium]MDW8260987.1 alpha/beta hydrolase [Phycisphaerales bacterium]